MSVRIGVASYHYGLGVSLCHHIFVVFSICYDLVFLLVVLVLCFA
jgi:hypothetical protein